MVAKKNRGKGSTANPKREAGEVVDRLTKKVRNGSIDARGATRTVTPSAISNETKGRESRNRVSNAPDS